LIPARRPGTDFHRILGKVGFVKGQQHRIPPQVVEFYPSKEAWNRLPHKVDFIKGEFTVAHRRLWSLT
jgi:hypothetical protein